jgi:ABC-type phosphate transport system substrate-binding protein
MGAASKLLAAMLLCMVVAGNATAESIAVIVNIKNPVSSISKEKLRKIYEDRMLKWENGTVIVVYELVVNDPVREAFSQIVFGSSSEKIAEMWAHLKITNQAKNTPINMKSEYMVLKMVSMDDGAIGYVSLGVAMSALKGAENHGLKIIGVYEQ